MANTESTLLSGLAEAGQELFTRALARYLADLTAMAEAERLERYPNNLPKSYTAMEGKRYLRIVGADVGGPSRWAHSFIDRKNGDVYKPAGWKGPAKGARGNIFSYDKIHEVAGTACANYR